ncbi:hypothetical protein SAMN04487948_104379 [Halogranum amylolyticum]|uniref:DUF7344 domain-containing protein n=1 Tax=Halogranum amylolyticum TaxID=660520 RepID=A0A1H8S1I5_9EURY|nr:hypothetical protein [Halogranum amylolyticum]SEO72520.1 hypothetical protein SAMN04487948_104379 [Halogranum amylolyticum]
MSTTVPSLAESEVYDILRNDRRRSVIHCLRATGGTRTVGDLADTIAASEADESPPPRNVRQSVYVSLHQTHLPKLDEAGIVAFDPAANEVRLLDGVEEVEAYLTTSTADAPTRPAPRLVLGLAVLGVSLVAVSLLDVPLVSAVRPVHWALVVLVAIAALALLAIVRTHGR